MSILKLLNVESAYGPIRAIRGVSLQVEQGEIGTVLGANGAGKSTILKTISGIIDPRKGSVEFAGADITAQDPAQIVQRGLSHVPEGREVFPLLLGARQPADGRLHAQRPRRAWRATWRWSTATFRSCSERAHQDAGLLSGGQQQMLSDLARADGRAAADPARRAEPRACRRCSRARSSRSSSASTASAARRCCWSSRTRTWRSTSPTTATCSRTAASSWKTPASGCARRTTSSEFYLGMKEAGARGERRWKKKKTWR